MCCGIFGVGLLFLSTEGAMREPDLRIRAKNDPHTFFMFNY